MKKNFKSITELNNYLNQKLIQAMDKVGKTAKQHMFDYVKEEMENRPEDKEVYERTWEYLNSIDKTIAEFKNGVIEVMIYYNTDKINPYIITEKFFNAHMSLDEIDYSNLIPLWMEKGTEGNPYHNQEPVGGFIDLRKWVESNFRNELKKELKKLGIATK